MFNMFGARPFGTPFAASTNTFGTSMPFGGNSSTFTAKTTGTSAGFGTPGFGSNTPAPTGGLFGQNTSSSTATGLFGGVQQTTTFGKSQNTGFSFGSSSTPSASGGLFGQNNQSTGTGLFATPVSNTAFGAKTPGFSGFGANTNAVSTGGVLFGGQSSGSTLFGQSSDSGPAAASGTSIKFSPPNGQDTIVKNGVTTNINTKHQCITAMKEYENKSIEELRMEDYAVNRKGKQQQAFGTLFGPAPVTQTTGFNVGGAFSGTGFGKSVGFGTSTGTSLFGKLQSRGLFGQQKQTAFGTTTAANTGLEFGTNTSTGSSLFGQQQKPTGLFAQKPLFGTSTAGSTGFRFSAGSSQGSSNLFAKPLPNNTFTGFNTASTVTSGFGFVPSSTSIKFNPPKGQDTIVKNGVTTNINTKHQCITAMKEYENKSIEELRLEDYLANQKDKQQRADGTIFGTTLATQATGLDFNGARSGTGFGTSGGFAISTRTLAFGQQQKQATDLFSHQNKLSLGTTTTISARGFGTSTKTVTSLFGEQQKLTGLMGQKPPSFGTSTIGSTGFSLKAVSQESSNLFCKSLANTFSSSSTAPTTTHGFESTTTEIKPKCMNVGSQTDFGESTVAEIKQKCMDAGSQTDFGYFARELIDTFKSTMKSKENPDPIPGKGHTSMIFPGIPSVDRTLHPSINKSKQLIMPRPSAFVACEVRTRSFASFPVTPNNSSKDSQGTNIANSTAEQFGSQTLVALPNTTTGKIPGFTPTVTTQWVLSETGASSGLPTTLGGVPISTASPSAGTISNGLSRLSIFRGLPTTTALGGLPTNTSVLSTVVASSLPIIAKPNLLLPSVTSSSPTGATSDELQTAIVPVVLPTTGIPIPTRELPEDISTQNNTSNSETETITDMLKALEISAVTPQQIKSNNGQVYVTTETTTDGASGVYKDAKPAASLYKLADNSRSTGHKFITLDAPGFAANTSSIFSCVTAKNGVQVLPMPLVTERNMTVNTGSNALVESSISSDHGGQNNSNTLSGTFLSTLLSQSGPKPSETTRIVIKKAVRKIRR